MATGNCHALLAGANSITLNRIVCIIWRKLGRIAVIFLTYNYFYLRSSAFFSGDCGKVSTSEDDIKANDDDEVLMVEARLTRPIKSANWRKKIQLGIKLQCQRRNQRFDAILIMHSIDGSSHANWPYLMENGG